MKGARPLERRDLIQLLRQRVAEKEQTLPPTGSADSFGLVAGVDRETIQPCCRRQRRDHVGSVPIGIGFPDPGEIGARGQAGVA